MKTSGNLISITLILLLMALLGCSKGDLEGVYEHKISGPIEGLTHRLIFKSGGVVEFPSLFSDNISVGKYQRNDDVVTVTFESNFGGKPTDFRIEADALIESDGSRWEKIN